MGPSLRLAHRAGEAPKSLTYCLSSELDLSVADIGSAMVHERTGQLAAAKIPNAPKLPW